MPSANEKIESRKAVKDLLLTEHDQLSEALWKNEQTGETRVNWLIGIVTATTGGLVGLTTAEHKPDPQTLRLIIAAALFALLCFGIVTLLRIMKRNEVTDGFKKDFSKIRQIFKQHFDDDKILENYHPFNKPENKDLPRRVGGLAHTVSTINSLLTAALIVSVNYPMEAGALSRRDVRAKLAYIGLISFLLVWVAQFYWIRQRDERGKS